MICAKRRGRGGRAGREALALPAGRELPKIPYPKLAPRGLRVCVIPRARGTGCREAERGYVSAEGSALAPTRV